MKKQDVKVSSIFFTYFGFGTAVGILFALLLITISNTYIIHHDKEAKTSTIISK